MKSSSLFASLVFHPDFQVRVLQMSSSVFTKIEASGCLDTVQWSCVPRAPLVVCSACRGKAYLTCPNPYSHPVIGGIGILVKFERTGTAAISNTLQGRILDFYPFLGDDNKWCWLTKWVVEKISKEEEH